MYFDLMIIFAFQSVYGYVFSWIGILVATFMAGAAVGALLTTKADLRPDGCLKAFFGIDVAIACFAVGCPFLLITAHGASGGLGADPFARTLFLLISFICGTLTGAQFPLANRIYSRNGSDFTRTAGLLYASDLLGGWFGGIVGAVVLLPILGIAGAGAAIGMVKIAGLIVLTVQIQQVLRGGNHGRLLF
jgi:spermidine synthase